jgi:hypothetical protein
MQIHRSHPDHATSSPHSLLQRPAWRLFDLFRNGTSTMLKRAAIAVAVAWVPLAILTATQGHAAFLSFLTDFATQSRFLLVISVLILGVPPLHSRYELVVHHFGTTLVADNQQARFQSNWRSHERLKDSVPIQVMLLLMTYAIALWLSHYLSGGGGEFLAWWVGSSGFRFFSLAGTWAFFVSYPLLAYLTFLWLWRQILWARFLRSTTLLNLRLIAVHPDHLGGLGFLEASLLAQLPFSFCLGVGLAGAIANRVFHEGEKVFAYRFLAPILIAVALLIAVAPYFFFTPTLMQMRRRGMLRYGSLAHAVGEQFEQKWLDRDDSVTAEDLTTTNFTSTQNLYAIAKNVDDIRVVPVSRINVYAFVVAALIPGIPVVIGALPFSVLMKAVLKLLA